MLKNQLQPAIGGYPDTSHFLPSHFTSYTDGAVYNFAAPFNTQFTNVYLTVEEQTKVNGISFPKHSTLVIYIPFLARGEFPQFKYEMTTDMITPKRLKPFTRPPKVPGTTVVTDHRFRGTNLVPITYFVRGRFLTKDELAHSLNASHPRAIERVLASHPTIKRLLQRIFPFFASRDLPLYEVTYPGPLLAASVALLSILVALVWRAKKKRKERDKRASRAKTNTVAEF